MLKDFSFTAKQGEVTALIGASGGGKTTVSRLAARFRDVTGGRITLGGMDISKTDPETLFSAFPIVFQDVTLFNQSVMDNIRIGKRTLPMKKSCGRQGLPTATSSYPSCRRAMTR